MRMKILALLVTLAVLGGANIAHADTTTLTDASIPPTSKTSKVDQTGRVLLTDEQMEELTAGHIKYVLGISVRHWHSEGFTQKCAFGRCIRIKGYWHFGW
jgi:hypothetical protein